MYRNPATERNLNVNFFLNREGGANTSQRNGIEVQEFRLAA